MPSATWERSQNPQQPELEILADYLKLLANSLRDLKLELPQFLKADEKSTAGKGFGEPVQQEGKNAATGSRSEGKGKESEGKVEPQRGSSPTSVK
jgi:hypothetical protein